MDARLALGAGEQPSIHRDRPDRPGTQGAVIFSGRQHRGSCRAGAGAVPASLHITALVSGAGSILHDSPGTEQSVISRAGSWVAGARGSCLARPFRPGLKGVGVRPGLIGRVGQANIGGQRMTESAAEASDAGERFRS